MAERIFTMSQRELDCIHVIKQVMAKKITQISAAKQLNISVRHVRRLSRTHERQGAKGLISKRRGRPSNNQLAPELKGLVIALISARYSDFGPTFAHEKLTEQHGLKLSIESTRKLMMSAGLWKGKRRKKAQLHPSRARRPQLGELVQIDGSPHAWFEDRAPKCCLIVFIDDATSRVMAARFVEVESTEAYFETAEIYIKKYGLPLSFYSDRHGIFRVNIPEAKSGTGYTQFGRALHTLEIELICANSPQAKGRVERMNYTLQDRLVKELRLRGISSIEAGNLFLPEFIEDLNQRFSVLPADPNDAHRPLLENTALDIIFTQQNQRKTSAHSTPKCNLLSTPECL